MSTSMSMRRKINRNGSSQPKDFKSTTKIERKAMMFLMLIYILLCLVVPISAQEEVCVTLIKYSNRGCHGKAVGKNKIPSTTKPGSPCVHSPEMGHNSVKDQYCVKNTFKQTVYIGNNYCHVPFIDRAISPMHLEYTTNRCTYGYKLESCTPGPCHNQEVAESNALELISQLR